MSIFIALSFLFCCFKVIHSTLGCCSEINGLNGVVQRSAGHSEGRGNWAPVVQYVNTPRPIFCIDLVIK